MPGLLGDTPNTQSVMYEGEGGPGGAPPSNAVYVSGLTWVITGNTWITGDTTTAAQVKFNIVAGSIGTTQIENLSISTAKVSADAITYAKLQNASAANVLLGRSTSGSGDFEEVTLTGNVTLAGNVTTIANDAVTFAKMANLSGSTTFIGRFTASAGDPEELSGASATQMLSLYTSTLRGAVPPVVSGTTQFLRADATWQQPPGTGSPTHAIKTDTQIHVASAGVSFANGLSFAITSGVTYYYEFKVLFGSSVTSTGVRLGLSYGAVNYGSAYVSIPIGLSGSASTFEGLITASGTNITGTAVAVINTYYLADMFGVINSSSDTTLNLMMGSEIAGTTIAVRAGSIGRLFTIS